MSALLCLPACLRVRRRVLVPGHPTAMRHYRQRTAARLAKHEQRSQDLETLSSTRHGKRASMSRPSATSAVKEVIERAQRAEF